MSIRNGELEQKSFSYVKKESKKDRNKTYACDVKPKQQFLQIWLKYERTYFANSIFVSASLSRYKTISLCRCHVLLSLSANTLSNTSINVSPTQRAVTILEMWEKKDWKKKKNPVRLMDAPSSPVTLYQMRRVRILQPCGWAFFVQTKRTFLTSEWTRTQIDSVNFNPLKRPFTRYLLRSKHPPSPLQKQGYGSSFYCYHKKS